MLLLENTEIEILGENFKYLVQTINIVNLHLIRRFNSQSPRVIKLPLSLLYNQEDSGSKSWQA